MGEGRKDPFEKDVLEDVISKEMQKRSADREKLREKKLRQQEKKKVAKENIKARQKVIVIAAIVLIVVGVLFSKSLFQIIELRAEKEEAQLKLDELIEKIERLEEEKKKVTSDEYIEQQAREQLRMIYPGEVLYIVLDR